MVSHGDRIHLIMKHADIIVDTPALLSYYESLLSLLQRLCQTKNGATQVLKTGLFQAVRESRLFAADPDLGIGKCMSASRPGSL
jgi:hypothetical protein